MPLYEESIPVRRWLLVIIVAAGAAMGVFAVLVLFDPEGSAASRVLLAIVLGVASLAMVFVARTFSILRVSVTDEAVDFGFRRLGKSLPVGQIVRAEPDRYPWLRYGGWGLRVSTGGYRAYSQAFVGTSVVIYAADHRSYHVSSRHPAELAGAINRVATAEVSDS